MRIGDAAAATGATPRALRLYEQRGLLPPPVRTPSGQRLYGSQELRRIQVLRDLMAVGLTLDDIGTCVDRLHLLEEGTGMRCTRAAPEAGGVVSRRVAALDSEIARLTRIRDTLLSQVGGPAPPEAEPAPGF
jgi:DNA-binding transcriptional MerR regulator